MQNKAEVYAEHLQTMVDKITRICESYGIPMMMAFCLDANDLGDGRMEMTVAGTTHLNRNDSPPEPMLLAASLLRIPGFRQIDMDFDLDEVLNGYN